MQDDRFLQPDIFTQNSSLAGVMQKAAVHLCYVVDKMDKVLLFVHDKWKTQ